MVGCSPEPEVCDFPVSTMDDVAWTESYLGLSPLEQAAVVRLQGTVGGQLSTCSGTLVRTDLVLTAAHCEETAAAPDALVELEGVISRVASLQLHDSADLMLLALDSPASNAGLQLVDDLDEAFLGHRVVVGGFGRTESAAAGVRHFTVQQIATLEGARVKVSPVGSQGPCAGDSGGPLIVSHMDSIRVAGVLSTVSPDCRGNARFTMLGSARDWLADEGIELSAAMLDIRECEDRCDGGVAVRCGDSDQLRDCASCDAVCAVSSGTAQAECFVR